MAERTGAPAGSIYDLGYRPYEGERLGRQYAAWSLFVYSLRAVFGLGRSVMGKVFPFGLAVVALIPAAIQLAIAAISPVEFEYIEPESYFGFVQIVVVLFCAAGAPEVVGRDQRNHTLPLYFSRALSRADYVSAKLAAFAAGIFAVVALPQLLLLLGSAVATDDLTGYLADNADLLAPIAGSSALVAAFAASTSLLIAAQTPRRAFATGGVLAYFVVFTSLGAVLVQTTTGDVQRYVLLLSPVHLLDGAVHWLFSAEPPLDSPLAEADLAGGFYVVAALAYIAVALALLYRRFLRMQS